MKINAIRGKNLASLEGDFEIDFTREPLSSAGIFAITGSTGAGKSTLLDALCLALFDNTPRTNNAGENLFVADIGDKSIGQGDPRNLLRRGTADGYAEVDFIALDGLRYRSRWMVRRARDKATGSLQPAEMRLTNLSSGLELPGRKTELLQKITDLIGLSFSQFTRSVLLAQGDFATFLKAKQNEKAELLEKLTGTEIYSRISIAVYEKTREAEQALRNLQDRIKEIQLLSPEELEDSKAEKVSLEKELPVLKNQSRIYQEKLDWYKQKALLLKSREEAERLCEENRIALREASPRKTYLQRFETAQEIRDVYSQWMQKQKQQKEIQDRLSRHKQQEEALRKVFDSLGPAITAAQTALEKGEQQYAALKPEIERAKVLDTQLVTAERNVEETRRELESQQAVRTEAGRKIEALKKEIALLEEKRNQALAWFEKHASYREIVPRTEMLVHMLEEIAIAKAQITGAQANLLSGKEICESFRKEEVLLQNELERLHQLLPAEVLPLRERLVEGEPCPVCGSLHHPVFTMESHGIGSLQEKELEAAKRQASERLETVRTRREESERQAERLQALIQTYEKTSTGTEERLAGFLSPLTDWQEGAALGTLGKELTATATRWVQYQEQLDHWETSLGQAKARLEGELPHWDAASDSLRTREEQFRQVRGFWQELRNERALLLQGKGAVEAEAYFERLRKSHTQRLEEWKTQKESQEKQIAEARGILLQLKNEEQTQTKEIARLRQELAEWIEGKKDLFTLEQLQELFGRERNWILREKEAVKQLEDREISLTARVKERTEKIFEWEQQPARPQVEETVEQLQQRFGETEEKTEAIHRRLTSVQVVLATHEQGMKQLASFEQERQGKTAAYEDWSKLNELFGSANGSKFKRIAQSYTLDALLVYANKQLEQLSKRYLIRRIPETLGLEVIDQDLFNDVRTVHSLSGGESFLVSLSLALGLSSLSSNRMKIESLFIDEGFGSLDMETLNTVMEALEALHTQGRKIGVISHVAEMTERIPTQITIIRTSNGRSRVEVGRSGRDNGL